MFIILDPAPKAAMTLKHSKNVFHEALKHGKDHYHIECGKGNYDIAYVPNTNGMMQKFMQKSHVKKILPEYLSYDENDLGSIYLDFFDTYKSMLFDEANEYTIVCAGLALENTDIEVYTLDKSRNGNSLRCWNANARRQCAVLVLVVDFKRSCVAVVARQPELLANVNSRQ